MSKYQDSEGERVNAAHVGMAVAPFNSQGLILNPCHYLVREGCFLIQVSSASGPNVKENADINIPWKTQEKLPFPRDSLCGRGVYDSRFWL